MQMTQSRYAVRPADSTDVEALTQILATGFTNDPPLVWILPDDADRARLSPAFFRPFVEMALETGYASVTEDYTGASLWLDVDVTAEPEDDGGAFRQVFLDGLGAEYAKRFFVLDDLFTAHHPGHESHAYLMFVGVTPQWQGRGVGTALLADRLRVLDEAGRPAYLEASCPRNAALYARLDFTQLGDGLTLPDGPTLYQMWRQPAGGPVR
jgi:ribosomal protein S18 acetylase RimI-like enzyme